MINELFRTRFESSLAPFITFVALNALLGLLLATAFEYPREAGDHAGYFAGVVSWMLIICLVAGGLGLLRHNRERHTRLYAQLPVTSVEVRLAYWMHASLYLCISSLLLVLIMVNAVAVRWLDILQFALLYFAHAGALLAVISILLSNTLRLIPEEIRKRTVIYFFMATFITFLLLFALGLVVSGYIHVQQEGVKNWWSLTLTMLLLCAALVALDIQLFRNKESYLD